MNISKQLKDSMSGYKVGNKSVTTLVVKSNKTDAGGNFYTYDLFDKDKILLAKNRYVYKNSSEQLFDELTEAEELILTPPVVIEGKEV